MDIDSIDFHSKYFAAYMKAVENTESPRLFHLWAAVGAMGCCLGRRVWLPFGLVGRIYANQYILLVGPPAVRKSSALNVAQRLLRESTNVKFAPTDTGGQRQGLIRAMSKRGEDSEALNELIDAGINDPFQSQESVETLENIQEEILHPDDKHVISAVWSELSGALGQANYSMMDFLVRTYDGEDYEYMTKHGEAKLKNTLMNILAATTPTSLSVTMPPLAEGHGFLSRLILVHGDENYQAIAWPEPPNEQVVMQVKDALAFVSRNLHGPLEVTADAKAYAQSLYGIQLEISDQRFAHYNSRRFTHLLKLASVLAASRMQMRVDKRDIEVAHTILRITERGMPDALGQFGLSPLSRIKQNILEFLRAAAAPVPSSTIQAAFHRDARPQDIIDALSDLMAGNAIAQLSNGKDGALYSAKRVKKDTINSEMAQFLIERK